MRSGTLAHVDRLEEALGFYQQGGDVLVAHETRIGRRRAAARLRHSPCRARSGEALDAPVTSAKPAQRFFQNLAHVPPWVGMIKAIITNAAAEENAPALAVKSRQKTASVEIHRIPAGWPYWIR